ncbi:MAG TPA: hypothetical protein VFA37_09745 [Gaiellaceae bacterium]|nr:hypothetical protein [Gaiellaceae bacterium]
MRRAVLACVAVLGLLALASAVLILRETGSGGTPASAPRPSARATLSSRSILFGDTVEARLDLIVPRRLARTTFDGHPNFGPFQILSSHVERADLGGGVERISLRYGIACLSRHCLGTAGTTQVQFSPTSISIPGGSLRAVWPPLLEVSRAQDVTQPVTDGLDSEPAVFPGLQPRRDTEEALVAAGASLVVLLAAWVVLRLRARRRRELLARHGSVLQALLARVEAGLPEDIVYRQRHALDALAVELRHRHVDGALAVHAERLAWAPEEPAPAEIRALCAEVRRLAKA